MLPFRRHWCTRVSSAGGLPALPRRQLQRGAACPLAALAAPPRFGGPAPSQECTHRLCPQLRAVPRGDEPRPVPLLLAEAGVEPQVQTHPLILRDGAALPIGRM